MSRKKIVSFDLAQFEEFFVEKRKSCFLFHEDLLLFLDFDRPFMAFPIGIEEGKPKVNCD